MADYGVYTLTEIYLQIYRSLPSSPKDLAHLRTYMEGIGGIPTSTKMTTYYMPNDFFAKSMYSGSQALTVPGSSASSAWSAYQSAQGATSAITGGATQGLQTVKSATTGYFKLPDTGSPTGYSYRPSVMLSMPLPTVAAAVAPIAGAAIGKTMYDDNPELWTKLSRALIPWAYPDGPDGGPVVDASKGLIPVWTDVVEAGGELVAKAFLPSFVVDAVKNFFTDEGIGDATDVPGDTQYGDYYGYSSGSCQLFWKNVTWPVGQTATYEISGNGPVTAIAIYNNNSYQSSLMVLSKFPFTIHTIVKNDGVHISSEKTSQSAAGYGGYYANLGPTNGRPVSGANNYPYGTNIDYRNVISSLGQPGVPMPTGYPEGMSKWSGTPYTLPSDPIQIVLEDENGNEQLVDAYPIPIPTTPGETISPDIQEIDDPIVDPTTQIDPYIQPTPDPYSEPAPTIDPTSQPGPEVDPSSEGEPTNPISPESPTPGPPPSDGSSPEPIPPTIPPPFTSEGGLIAIYNPTQAELISFANWLWVTYQDATIQKIWNNPFDGVISLHELYATPIVNGRRTIRSGFLDSEVASDTVARYSEINCGSIVIPEYWANYLDYAPYTKAFVYLPFIGIIELEADDIVGHAVNITYRVDAYNGSCIAMITVAKQGPSGEIYNNTVYQFSGNCAVELPLTGGTQANIKAAVINATAWGLGSVINGITSAIGGKPISGIGQAVSGAIEATASVVNAKSSVQHSGTFGASFGAMGIKKPYIIIKRPIQVQVLNYNEIYGYQAHKAVTIGSCTGYLRCREVHVMSATANDEEKTMIENLLKTGVYLTE